MNNKISIICPARNEATNLPILLQKLVETFVKIHEMYEVVIVNDASTDETLPVLRSLAEQYPFLKYTSNKVREGKATVILSGLRLASGKIIVIMDADLQYWPEDIPQLLQPLKQGQYDIVSGWRQGEYTKKAGAKIFNVLNKVLFNVPLHDSGAMFAAKREILEKMYFFMRKDWHRFVFPFASMEGYRIGEVKITLHPRHSGASKYTGFFRLFFAFLDLLTFWMKTYFSQKPMLIFGSIGLLFFSGGIFFGIVYTYSKFVVNINWRLSITNVTFLLSVGVLCLLFGFIGELLVDVICLVERTAHPYRKLWKDADPDEERANKTE